MSFCSRCGVRLAPEAAFCAACGAAVLPLAEPAPTPSSTQQLAIPDHEPASIGRTRRGRWRVGVAVLVIVGVIIAAGILVTIVRRGNGLPPKETPTLAVIPGLDDLYEGDPARGVQALRSAADAGNAAAAYWMSRLTSAGFILPRDSRASNRFLDAAAAAGDNLAMSMLGQRLLWGAEIDKDERRGFEFTKKAVDSTPAPSPKALYRLGQAYWLGMGVPKNLGSAGQFLERSAAGGFGDAFRDLGFYAQDSGREADAVKNWRLAAEQAGSPEAQVQLYWSYRDGTGVPQDAEQAFYWLQRSARLGDDLAQASLSYEYSVGKMVEKNEWESLRWGLRAAQRGNGIGMFNAATSLQQMAKASGSRETLSLAYMFFNLAASKQVEDAAATRDAIAAELSREELLQAQAGARNFEAAANDLSTLSVTSTGTGVFYDVGVVATNEHVIGECAKLAVETPSGVFSNVTVVAGHAGLDLAILEVDPDPGKSITRRLARLSADGPVLGERLTVFGYPLSGLLTNAGTVTTGTLSANAGLQDDTTRFQFSAPVQPGNSGGAVVDDQGRVMGVVQAVLNPLSQGENVFVPQNVNFAIKGREVRRLLEANGYTVRVAAAGAALDPKQIAARAQSISARILCYNHPVEAVIDKMK